jgi:hypothetical protein
MEVNSASKVPFKQQIYKLKPPANSSNSPVPSLTPEPDESLSFSKWPSSSSTSETNRQIKKIGKGGPVRMSKRKEDLESNATVQSPDPVTRSSQTSPSRSSSPVIPQSSKPHIYDQNGYYAAEIDFDRNASILLVRILEAFDQRNPATILDDLGITASPEWVMEYLESALLRFGFEESAAQVRCSFEDSVGVFNQEYSPATQAFVAVAWGRYRGCDLQSLFDN